MAIVGRREAAKAAAALDMPSPPIASADSATSSSIWPSRSMKRRVPRPGLIAAGRAPAALGEALLERLAGGFGIGAGGQQDAIAGAC